MKKIFSLLATAFLLIQTLGFADGEDIENKKDDLPWLTGPLLTPSGHVVPIGYFNIEPYLYYNTVTGIYGSNWDSTSTPHFHNLQLQLPLYIGLTPWMDILMVGQGSRNWTEGQTDYVINDTTVAFDFQILKDKPTNNLPGVKVYVSETFPTGPYQKLNASKLGTDIGGEGVFETTLGFVITRLLHVQPGHYLALRFNGLYNLPANTHVKGVNAYGGSPDTRGKIHIGASFAALLGLEYSLTQRWALATDLYAIYRNKVTFSGKKGKAADGTPASVGLPSSFQFSLAPAIEYNWSDALGVIGGVWFTVVGRNIPRFFSGVIALNYYGPIHSSAKSKTPGEYQSSGGGGGP